VLASRLRHAAARFCSKACESLDERLQANRQEALAQGRETIRKRPKAIVMKLCPQCGESFEVDRCDAEARVYCSRGCSARGRTGAWVDATCANASCGDSFSYPAWRLNYNVPTYCSVGCLTSDPANAARLGDAREALRKGRRTRLEIAGSLLLDELGLAHEQQVVIGGKFAVDALLANVPVAVEWDGDYWHGNPDRFPEPDARQLKQMGEDRSKNAYLAACGLVVVRIWESALKHDRDACAKRILAAVEQARSLDVA
jgi:very-short-patch-repair endonuclease